jgi:membrane protein implicated in regulation of membrane protease activity
MSIRTQGTTLFTAILILVATTVALQLWLLTFSMEALLRGSFATLIPAAIASTFLLIINALLLRYVFRFDREAKKDLR